MAFTVRAWASSFGDLDCWFRALNIYASRHLQRIRFRFRPHCYPFLNYFLADYHVTASWQWPISLRIDTQFHIVFLASVWLL